MALWGKCNQEARMFLEVGSTKLQEYMDPKSSEQGFIRNKGVSRYLCSGGNL